MRLSHQSGNPGAGGRRFARLLLLRYLAAAQLSNKAQQAEHHYTAGRDKQAIKHLEDLLKALDKPASQQHISAAAKLELRAEVEALISALSE